MLRKIKPHLTSIVLIAGFLFIFLINFMPSWHSANDGHYDMSTLGEAGLPEAIPLPDDTTLLTYNKFSAMEQTRKDLESRLEQINRGRSGSAPFIGFSKYSECYDCETAEDFRSKKETHRYYLLLPGYSLRDDDSRFLIRRGQYYLKLPVWDTIYERPNGTTGRAGHYEYKSVPFRFAHGPATQEAEQKGSVLIPVSDKTYKAFSQPVFILTMLAGLALLYICIGLPAKILLRISRGEIFTRKNVRQLYLAAWCWLLPPFILIFLQYIMKWIFHRYITDDVTLTAWQMLTEKQFMLIGGLVLLAIAQAFDKGLSLQHEQDLTI